MDDFVFDPKKYEGHSPAPWRWHHGGDDRSMPALLDGEGTYVMHFGDAEPYYPTEGDPPAEPDRTLIADAPALLVYIEKLRQRIEQLKDVNEVLRNTIRDVY